MHSNEGAFEYSIEIAQGLGDITFGLTAIDVQRHLGEPDETEILDPGCESTLMWYYVSHKLQIIFQQSVRGAAGVEQEVHRIVQLTASHPSTTLWGTKIIGRTEAEVLLLFWERGYQRFVECNEPVGDSEYRSFRMDDLRLTLDFLNSLLQRVLWGSLEAV